MIINCTPHDVAIYGPDECYMYNVSLCLREGNEKYPEPLSVYPAAKESARAIYEPIVAGRADRCLIYRRAPREIIGLPEPKAGTYYIVSKMVAQACPKRKDLIFPGTVVRGTPKGSRWMSADDHVVGCIDFSRV